MKYGWFTVQGAPRAGLRLYKRPDGSLVTVTSVSDSPTDSGTKWEDIVCLGPVAEFVSVLKRGSLEGPPPEFRLRVWP